MPEKFDAYHKWLSIPPRDQPPNHYRLLGLTSFEGDAETIASAADRQMAHVRTFQTGRHSADSQKLLNELSAARVCLLNPEKKAAYDAALREKLEAARPAVSPQPAVPPQPAALPPPAMPAQWAVPRARPLPVPMAHAPRGALPMAPSARWMQAPVAVGAYGTPAPLAQRGAVVEKRTGSRPRTIHQIYCTHCTFGSSALEQRDGELAERVLGYSARAGSMERDELRGFYRQVERFLHYHLPGGSPPDERLKLDATTAPCRMFFSPSTGKLQLLGQVVYRRHDTAGRAGSYFAHLLISERDAAPWPVLDCLRLWGAPWMIEDSPDHPKRLPGLARLGEIWRGRTAALDDRLLLNFLATPPGNAFDDPRRVIPVRWRATSRAERSQLIVDACQGYIELGSDHRDNVLLVCEPSLAALVFYAVARLLPPGAVREGISFSTYEPSPDRLPFALAATTFCAPESIDLKPDVYRRRGYVYNTFLKTRSAAGRPGGTYARLLVETLLAKGWQAVDRLLDEFAGARCGKLEDLESLAQTHRAALRLLDPAATVDPAVWDHSPVAERYLGAAVERQLAAVPPDGPQLRALIGSPRQMLVIDLAASQTRAEPSPGLRFLLRNVPPTRLNEVLSSPRISREAKAEALASHLSSTGRLPDECESLWTEGAGAVSPTGSGGPLVLSAALARLAHPALASLLAGLPVERREAFVVALARACVIEPRRQAVLQRILAEAVAALDEARLLGLLSRYRADLRTAYPKPEPLLGHRLSKLLFEIPERPREFARRLEALAGWTDYFPDRVVAEHRLAQWRKVHSILQSLRGGKAKKPGSFFRRGAKPDYQGLAVAMSEAMPKALYIDDPAGTVKKKRLRELGTQVVGSAHFLPTSVWNKITRYFEHGDWPEGGKKRAAGTRAARGAEPPPVASQPAPARFAFLRRPTPPRPKPIALARDAPPFRVPVSFSAPEPAPVVVIDTGVGNRRAIQRRGRRPSLPLWQRLTAVGACSAFLLLLAGVIFTFETSDDEWVSLFNGKDLTGWTTHPSQQRNWRVEEGVLVGSGPKISHLVSKRGDFTDFHLRVEACVNDSGTGGVSCRSTFRPEQRIGYEVGINGQEFGYRTGSLQRPGGVDKAGNSPVRANEWFTLEIIAKDNHIVVKINDRITDEYRDSSREFTMGHLALHQRDPEVVIKFREIEIRDRGRGR